MGWDGLLEFEAEADWSDRRGVARAGDPQEPTGPSWVELEADRAAARLASRPVPMWAGAAGVGAALSFGRA